MNHSTTKKNKGIHKYSKLRKLTIVLFWLCIWQFISIIISQDLLFAGPVSVIHSFGNIIKKSEFWFSVLGSFVKISSGFFIAFIMGILLAIFSYRFYFLRELLSPIIHLIKVIPVASFIILVLVWFNSENISIFISFFVVFPIIYLSVLDGLCNVDEQLLEMACVFHISNIKKIRYIYISYISPFVISSCKISLGMCWRAGIAAEIIGLSNNSIGQQLYMSKIYLDTSNLFAWTVVIIIISIVFEKLFLYFLNNLKIYLEGSYGYRDKKYM